MAAPVPWWSKLAGAPLGRPGLFLGLSAAGFLEHKKSCRHNYCAGWTPVSHKCIIKQPWLGGFLQAFEINSTGREPRYMVEKAVLNYPEGNGCGSQVLQGRTMKALASFRPLSPSREWLFPSACPSTALISKGH